MTPLALYREGRLREAIVLVRVELIPLSISPPSNWKDICQKSLDTLRRCVYLDKDLVLPVSGNIGISTIFLVAASTDLERAEIMIKRIREQLEARTGFKAYGSLKVSASEVPLLCAESSAPLEDLVRAVADQVTEMAMLALASTRSPESANGYVNVVRKGSV